MPSIHILVATPAGPVDLHANSEDAAVAAASEVMTNLIGGTSWIPFWTRCEDHRISRRIDGTLTALQDKLRDA